MIVSEYKAESYNTDLHCTHTDIQNCLPAISELGLREVLGSSAN